jgi:oligoribonuclease NrnB/cAMP/cGMP phosphodiesterase (DHH superfamily)
MRNIVIIYHKDCFDGFGAAWSAWKKFGDKAQYIAADHKQVLDSIKNLKSKEIYFLDFGYKKEIMEGLVKRNKKVVLIDHHISRQDILPIVSEYSFSLDYSGAVLSWRYFHQKKKIPRLLLYIQDLDLWRFNFSETSALMSRLSLFDYDFSLWNKVALDFENYQRRRQYIKEGLLLNAFAKKMIDFIARRAEVVVFENHKALAVNSPVFGSELGNYFVKEKNMPLGIVWSYDGEGIRVQLRSGKLINVADLAKKYGGGGHRQAAGFYWQSKLKLPWRFVEKKR